MPRGEGKGQGGAPQGDGGAIYCRCPACGHTMSHKKGTPCTMLKCPKCGTQMTGT